MLQEEAQDLGDDTAAFGGDLQKIPEAGQHLLGLINDILDLAKVEAGRMDLFLEDFAVADLVRGVAAVAAPLARQRGNRLVVDCPEGLGAMRSDLTKVRQALYNLLSNAAKFTERGQITLTAAREPGEGEGEGTRRGRGRLARLPGRGHGDRDDPRAAGAPVRGVHPGRGVDHAPVRRHRPGPGPDPPLLPDDGRRRDRGERAGRRLHLHHPPAGDRAPGGAGGRATGARAGRGRGSGRGGPRRGRCW